MNNKFLKAAKSHKLILFGIFFCLSFFFANAAFADLSPGNISTCGTISAVGTYTVTANVGTSGHTCFVITPAASGAVITSSLSHYIINGNITATTTTTNANGTSFIISGSIVMDGNILATGNGTGGVGMTTFNDSSHIGGNITGDATFNGNSYNRGTISGNATFNDSSYNGGNIDGNATFNTTYYDTDNSTVPSGGVFVISGNQVWSGIVGGTVYGSDGQPITSYEFYDSSYSRGTISGNATFNDSGNNSGTISGNATFNDSGNNGGEITGDATFNGSSYNGGDIDGNATFNTTYYDADNSTVPSGGVFVISGNQVWSGIVGGTVYGSDGQPITSYEFYDSSYNNGNITGPATFNDSSYNGGDIDGNATFNGSSYNGGNITGPATFNDSSYNGGPITGDATFNGSSYNGGDIDGNATFNGSSYMGLGYGITGNATFNTTYYDTDNGTVPSGGVFVISGSQSFGVDVDGTVYGSDGQPITNYEFYDSSYNNGNITGPATFNDSSQNNGTVDGNATFYNFSFNTGTVHGNATFNGSSYNGGSGTVNGNATFNDSSEGSSGTIIGNATFNTTYYDTDNGTVPSGGVFVISGSQSFGVDVGGTVYGSDGQPITNYEFYGESANSTYLINSNATFNGSSYNGGSGTVNGNATFNDGSYNNGIVTGTATINEDEPLSELNYGTLNNVIFNGGSFNDQTIYGNATFNDGSYNNGIINSNANFYNSSSNYGTVNSDANFNDNSYNDGDITGDATFNGSSYNGGDITGDATFNGSSYNGGDITGNATFNDSSSNGGNLSSRVDVFYPVSRPLSGYIPGGTITYHGYPGLYFNDMNTGNGDWGDQSNWWTDDTFTTPAGTIPYSGDSVYIYSNISTDTSYTTSSYDYPSATFEGQAQNEISLNVDNATFNATSSNAGSITGYATFIGDASDESGGTSGGAIRIYNTDATTTRDFTTEGGISNWLIQAYNSTVNLTNAIYSASTDIFQAFSNSIFIPNPSINSGASVVPQVAVSFPTSGTITKWTGTSIAWGNATSCSYEYDSGGYTSAICADNGSDILRPSAGTHTLSVKGSDAKGNLSEKIITFTYVNNVPTYTSCGTDVMDEATRPYYYLASNVTGNCSATVNTTLYGTSTISAIAGGYTLNGNIDAHGHAITLKNITVTGTIQSNGASSGANGGAVNVQYATTTSITANGVTGTNGGNGGAITIATSTTGAITANAATGSTNGGNGGTVTIRNSYGTPLSSTITANGANSTSCGNGGDSGIVSLVNSTYGTITATAGSSNNSGCSGQSYSSGNSHTASVSGGYSFPAPPSQGTGNSSQSNTSSSNSSGGSSGGGAYTYTGAVTAPNVTYTDNNIHSVVLNFIQPEALNLKVLPTFGDATSSAFSFQSTIGSFLFAPLPNSVLQKFKLAPDLGSYLASVGLSNAQQLANLKKKSIALPSVLPDPLPAGLFSVEDANGNALKALIIADPKNYFVEKVQATENTSITVSFVPEVSSGNIVGIFNDKGIKFSGSPSSATITLPKKAGRYLLTTPSSPLILAVDVIAPSSAPQPSGGGEPSSAGKGLTSALTHFFSWITGLLGGKW